MTYETFSFFNWDALFWAPTSLLLVRKSLTSFARQYRRVCLRRLDIYIYMKPGCRNNRRKTVIQFVTQVTKFVAKPGRTGRIAEYDSEYLWISHVPVT